MKTFISENLQSLESKRHRLQNEIASLADMRQGSLMKIKRRCGKSNCHCTREGDPGHRPTLILTRRDRGKTVTRSIPAPKEEATREQLEVFQRYQELVRELVDVSIQICDLKLKSPDELSSDTVKKNS